MEKRMSRMNLSESLDEFRQWAGEVERLEREVDEGKGSAAERLMFQVYGGIHHVPSLVGGVNAPILEAAAVIIEELRGCKAMFHDCGDKLRNYPAWACSMCSAKDMPQSFDAAQVILNLRERAQVLEDLNERASKENEELVAKMNGDPKLRRFETNEEGTVCEVEHWGVKVIAASLMGSLGNAPNFITTEIRPGDSPPIEVTIRRMNGTETPVTKIRRLKEACAHVIDEYESETALHLENPRHNMCCCGPSVYNHLKQALELSKEQE
jgi:hypothetical protein